MHGPLNVKLTGPYKGLLGILRITTKKVVPDVRSPNQECFRIRIIVAYNFLGESHDCYVRCIDIRKEKAVVLAHGICIITMETEQNTTAP
jgi:hypothetical protein